MGLAHRRKLVHDSVQWTLHAVSPPGHAIVYSRKIVRCTVHSGHVLTFDLSYWNLDWKLYGVGSGHWWQYFETALRCCGSGNFPCLCPAGWRANNFFWWAKNGVRWTLNSSESYYWKSWDDRWRTGPLTGHARSWSAICWRWLVRARLGCPGAH